MSKRRGKRIVVGYVVSHTGKRGGPWEAEHENGHRAFRWRSQRRWCRMRMRCLYRATDPRITFAVPRDRQGRRVEVPR